MMVRSIKIFFDSVVWRVSRNISMFILVCLALSTPLSFAYTEDSVPVRSGYVGIQDGWMFFTSIGTGEPLIFIHGGPGLDHTCLLPHMLELSKNHQLIFYDQRGSGKSLNASIDPCYLTPEQFIDDLDALCTALKLNQVTLVGHSWGALVALAYAAYYPSNTKAVVALNPAPATGQDQIAFSQELTKRKVNFQKELVPFADFTQFCSLTSDGVNQLYRTLFSLYFHNPQDVQHLNLTMEAASAQSGYKVMGTISQQWWGKPSTNLLPLFKSVNAPTFVIHGMSDVCPVSATRSIVQALPNAQLVCFNDCGHFSYVEKTKELFGMIQSFLISLS